MNKFFHRIILLKVVEMAGVLLKIAKSVKIISRSEVPFAKSLGKQFGTAIKKVSYPYRFDFRIILYFLSSF